MLSLARRGKFGILAGFLALISGTAGQPADPDGTLHVQDLRVPLSSFLSPEARSYMLHLLRDQPFAGGPSAGQDIKAYRARQDEIMNWFLKPIRERYPVNVEHKTIAGIYADIVTPKDGVAPKNRNRVLLNVHGGGFVSGARTAALVESIPIAYVEKIKIITIDYRMGPEYKFPAASEDVAAVYKEVVREYSPQHIGLYGCSAGGMLAAMSIAWFQKNHIPNPSAIGVLCASIGELTGGDASFISGPLNGFATPAGRAGSDRPVQFRPAYLSNVDATDPLAYPINSPALVAQFPPTLLVTSTRGMEYSSTINSHNALVRAGVDAELHVWDGLPHAFWYNSDLPESREVYDVIARFFDRHFGK
ncbi:MAG: alpha/beta hydrolase [Bryobacteraceae bacterium]